VNVAKVNNITVHYAKAEPTNASEMVAFDYLTRLGRLKDGQVVLPVDLTSMLGEALLESDASLTEFVKRYAVVL